MCPEAPTIDISDENQIPDFDKSVITGIYRDIVDLAVGGTTIPPQFAFLTAKVYMGARMAGKVTFEGLDCDSSYYGAAIGITGTSKGESWRRSFEKILNPPELTEVRAHLKVIYSADSGAGLKDAFFEPPDPVSTPECGRSVSRYVRSMSDRSTPPHYRAEWCLTFWTRTVASAA